MRILVNDIGTVVDLVKRYNNNLDVLPPFDKDRAKLMPNYMYDHRKVMVARLNNMGKDMTMKKFRYPLIGLRLDNMETISSSSLSYNLNILIAAESKVNYTSVERTKNVFVPVLYPLYEMFFKALENSGLFQWDPKQGINGLPPHTKVDRYFYGKAGAEGNDGYIFDDCLDAIEIINLKILSTNLPC